VHTPITFADVVLVAILGVVVYLAVQLT